MFELSGAAALVQTLGWIYVAVTLGAIGLALYLPKAGWLKALLACLVAAAFIGYPAVKVTEIKVEKNSKDADYRARLAKAQALFDERCKTAGEKIHKTVENVKGARLLNLRPEKIMVDSQFERYDPYGYYGGGDEYIKSFLPGYGGLCVGDSPKCAPEKRAFNFVEVQNEKDASARYTTVDKQTDKPILPDAITTARLIKEPLATPQAQYGVRWDDISTDADRQAWIAGGRLAIVDLKTSTVIAERTGFLLDPGQGNTDGFRSPWAWARNYSKGCPDVAGHNFVFVRKILKPIQGK